MEMGISFPENLTEEEIAGIGLGYVKFHKEFNEVLLQNYIIETWQAYAKEYELPKAILEMLDMYNVQLAATKLAEKDAPILESWHIFEEGIFTDGRK